MRRHSVVEVLTGAIVLIVAAGFLGYALAHSGRSGGSGYDLSANFDHIDGLGVGSDVRVAGVKVGTVTSEQIDPKSFEAVVNFTVRDDIRLPKDSAAIITSESLLGGKYVSLQPGGDDAALRPGAADHHYPGIGEHRGTVGQIHLQHDQRAETRPVRPCVRPCVRTGAGGWDGEALIPPPPTVWPQTHGAPVSCREKLRMLAENHAELAQAMQDAFEDFWKSPKRTDDRTGSCSGDVCRAAGRGARAGHGADHRDAAPASDGHSAANDPQRGRCAATMTGPDHAAVAAAARCSRERQQGATPTSPADATSPPAAAAAPQPMQLTWVPQGAPQKCRCSIR